MTELDELPPMFVIIGDADYEATEDIVLPMFYGISKTDEECDNFNFYASQCRIRIEMAFGLMLMKWGILWRPMRVKLRNIKWIVNSISQLHNFVINEQLRNNECNEETTGITGRAHRPSEEELELYSADTTIKQVGGVSIIRDTMVERIVNLGLKRPAKNIIQNRDDDDDEY